jgi:hypothetical protein
MVSVREKFIYNATNGNLIGFEFMILVELLFNLKRQLLRFLAFF